MAIISVFDFRSEVVPVALSMLNPARLYGLNEETIAGVPYAF